MPPFVHGLRVRYHECDPQGIVFNATHFAYFDVVLTELWRAAFGSYGAMVASGTDVQVVDASAAFHAPARFDDELELAMTIVKLGTSSITSAFEERRGDELLVSGRLVHVCVDAATHVKQPIPPDMRARLAPWVQSEPEGDAAPEPSLAARSAEATATFLDAMRAAGNPGATTFETARRSVLGRAARIEGWVVRPVDREDFEEPRRYEPGLVLAVDGRFHRLESELRGWGQRDFPRYHHTASADPVEPPADDRLPDELAALRAAVDQDAPQTRRREP